MPNFEAVAVSIETKLRADWSTTPLIAQNVAYKPIPGTAFVYYEILSNLAFFASIGNPGGNYHRNVGQILLHVFVPVNSGDGLALTYARQLGTVFKGKYLDNINFGAASIGAGETADDKGNFWRRTVSIDFRFDELA
jgi:hypothetical protein